jgi:hypothetical protein
MSSVLHGVVTSVQHLLTTQPESHCITLPQYGIVPTHVHFSTTEWKNTVELQSRDNTTRTKTTLTAKHRYQQHRNNHLHTGDPTSFFHHMKNKSPRTLYIPLHGRLKYIQYNAAQSTISTSTSAGQKLPPHATH